MLVSLEEESLVLQANHDVGEVYLAVSNNLGISVLGCFIDSSGDWLGRNVPVVLENSRGRNYSDRESIPFLYDTELESLIVDNHRLNVKDILESILEPIESIGGEEKDSAGRRGDIKKIEYGEHEFSSVDGHFEDHLTVGVSWIPTVEINTIDKNFAS